MRSRRTFLGAFTLLEAVIALVGLSSVVVSVLSLRSQTLRSAQRLSERRFVERETESIFRMLLAGMLDQPVREESSGQIKWTGTHLGEGYEIVREYTRIANPMLSEASREQGRVVSPEISLWKYTITLGGRTNTFYWHT